MKKVLAMILAVAMVVGMAPAALAVGTTVTDENGLKDAVAAGGEIVLGGDIALTAPITVNGTVVLDLNGKTLSFDSTTMDEAMITNKGNLTINDSSDPDAGQIYYNYHGEIDANHGKGNYTISNAGTLTVNGGKIWIEKISQHAKYPIDNNSTTGDAVLVINGGHLYNYNTSAIRQFCNSTTNENSVTINGGLIEGYSAIWMQNPGKNTVNGSLTITGGEIRTTAKAYVDGTSKLKDVSSKIYFSIDGEGGAWSEGSAVTITGGTFNENVKLDEDVPAVIIGEGATFNGYLKVLPAYIDGVGYETLAAAIDAAESGDTVTLLSDVTISEMIAIDEPITLDLGSNKVTSTAKKAFEIYADATIKNGSIVAEQRCVDTRTAVDLTLTDVTLEATKYYAAHGNQQPLTIGGSDDGTKVIMNNVSIDAGTQGYGIITFVKTELTATNSTIGGYSALYVKPGSDESTFNFVNTDLSGTTGNNDVAGNSFSAIAVRANNVTVNVDKDSSITAVGSYTSAISLGGRSVGEETTTGAKITVYGTVTGNIMPIKCVDDSTVILPAKYTDKLLDEGFEAVIARDDDMIVVYATLAGAVAKNGSITGGTFSSDPTAHVDTEDYIAKKISDTEYEVIEKANLGSGTYMSDPTGATKTNYKVKDNEDGTWKVYYVSPTTTTKTENEDGSTTTTVTNNKTGTKTETTENTDGSTTVVETNKDGSSTTTNTNTTTETTEDGATTTTETKTEEKVEADGSTTKTDSSVKTETAADGSATTTETKTEEKVAADGTTTTTKTEATTNTAADGTVSAETKVEEVVKTETTTTTTTTTTTETAEKTESVAVKEETVVAEDGTETTTTTTTVETALADGSTASTVTDNEGNVEAKVTVSEEAVTKAAEEDTAVVLPMPAVTAAAADAETTATVTVNTGSEEDVTVAIPVAEGTGEGTVAVIVDADGNETIITDSVVTENGLEVTVPDGATVKVVDNSADYDDVENKDWHKDAVDFTSARQIMNGVEGNSFAPTVTTTRAMVWTMLARLAGVDTSTGETWDEVGREWAMANGISDGTNGDAEITREQLATMLYRYVGSPEHDHEIDHFHDAHETSDWALAAKQWAVGNKVINGKEAADGTLSLDPTGDASRAEVAQMFMNFIKNV